MLVLMRKAGQSIMLGDDIEVCILGAQAGQVRVGIRAPRSMPVHRREVWIRIKNGQSGEPLMDAWPESAA